MEPNSLVLSPDGLRRFVALQGEAVESVTARFYREEASIYAQFGERGRAACREDLGYHLEFLRPVLEFGLREPMVDYLQWLAEVLETRGVPNEHLRLSLDWLAEFFTGADHPEAGIIVAALRGVSEAFRAKAGLRSALDRMPESFSDREPFEAALLAGDYRTAAAIVERGAQERGLIETEMHVVQPALYGIGQAWQRNQVSVAQEHLATAIAQSAMMRGLVKSQAREANGKHVLLACVEGNQHAVGLQMVADAFQLAGWEVTYLGANVPSGSLVEHVGVCKPHLVGLSVSFPHQLRIVKDVIGRMREKLGAARPPIIVGGLAINNFDALAAKLGADAWSPDAMTAVAAGDRLAA